MVLLCKLGSCLKFSSNKATRSTTDTLHSQLCQAKHVSFSTRKAVSQAVKNLVSAFSKRAKKLSLTIMTFKYTSTPKKYMTYYILRPKKTQSLIFKKSSNGLV